MQIGRPSKVGRFATVPQASDRAAPSLVVGGPRARGDLPDLVGRRRRPKAHIRVRLWPLITASRKRWPLTLVAKRFGPSQNYDGKRSTRSAGRSVESVSCGVEIVFALFGLEQVADLSDGLPEFVDGSDGPSA
jgi:hypothetical protein